MDRMRLDLGNAPDVKRKIKHHSGGAMLIKDIILHEWMREVADFTWNGDRYQLRTDIVDKLSQARGEPYIVKDSSGI